jgi:chondroitin AC lyase
MSAVELVRARLRDEMWGGPPGPVEAARLSGVQAADGTWADIDYSDRDHIAFRPMEHVARARRLAFTKDHKDAAVRALDAWRRRGPRSDNWWFNEIGAPQLVGDALLLLAGELDPRQRVLWDRWLADCAGGGEMTGQNLIWAQGIVLRRGLLVADGDLIASAVAQMSTVLRPTDGEGIQRDLSFHQHGAQLYSGGYGSNLTADLALWIYVVHGTPWAFGARELRLFTDFLLDGQQWAVHGGGFDFTTLGRTITRAGAHNSAWQLRGAIRQLLAADAPRSAELRAFGARLDGAPDHGPIGCRYYPSSDYLVHRRPTWSVSVRMSSTRTIPTESMNGENLRGRHLGDGVAAIRVGDHAEDGYRAIIPLWDWARLPGITAEQPADPAALLPRPYDQYGSSADVGGWTDGHHGIAVMRLAGTDRITDGWKAWFCFDDLVVALGAAITAPSATRPVLTTIDHRQAQAPMVSEPGPAGPRYIHHGRIGYVPLSDHTTVLAGTEHRTGSWSDITKTGAADRLSAEVFTIGFDHGPRPHGASYACLILPDTDSAITAEQSVTPDVTVVSNTADLQAVHHHRTGLTLQARHDGTGMAQGMA